MSDNTEALRCADALERRGYAPSTKHAHLTDREVATHIRRLVAENEALRRDIAKQNEVNLLNVETLGYDLERLRALNAELVEALQWIADRRTGGLIELKARAALAKVEASK